MVRCESHIDHRILVSARPQQHEHDVIVPGRRRFIKCRDAAVAPRVHISARRDERRHDVDVPVGSRYVEWRGTILCAGSGKELKRALLALP